MKVKVKAKVSAPVKLLKNIKYISNLKTISFDVIFSCLGTFAAPPRWSRSCRTGGKVCTVGEGQKRDRDIHNIQSFTNE